jgi:predicted ArsR family transcriptional regulator
MTENETLPDLPKQIKPTKSAIVQRLLARPKGASLGDITAATGWQAHSIRSFLSGLRKKGVILEREQRRDGATGYRIVKPTTAPVAPSVLVNG